MRSLVKFPIRMIRLVLFSVGLLSLIPATTMYHFRRKTPGNPRVVLAMHGFNTGGIERLFIDTHRILVEHGCECNFVFFSSPSSIIPLPENAEVAVLGGKTLRSQIYELMKYVTRERPDIIYAATPSMVISACAVRLLLLGRIRLIARLDSDYRTRIRIDPKYVSQINRIMFWLLWVPHWVITMEESLMEDSKKLSKFPANFIVLRNPADLDNIILLSEDEPNHPWLAGEYRVVLNVGRLNFIKNQAMALRSFAMLANQRENVRLILLGDGDLREELESLANDLGISHLVNFMGNVVNPYAIMRRSNVMVVSSQCEGGPLVTVEAMACGLSIVSTNFLAANDMLENGKFGEIVELNDDAAMCDAVVRLLDTPTDHDMLIEASNEYSIDKHAHGILEIMQI